MLLRNLLHKFVIVFYSYLGSLAEQVPHTHVDRCFCRTPVLSLGLGVDFAFSGDNHKIHKNENNNPHLNFLKGTVLGGKEQGLGIRDKR